MSENKYNNSKIYLIKCRLDDNLIYVGSTVQKLNDRWNQHKQRTNKEKYNNILLYLKMREIGVDFFFIELYKNINCDCKEVLNNIEGEIIRMLGTLNKRIEGRTIKEYRNDNKTIIKEKREQNKEKIKDYYVNNKEKFKDYYENNKEKNKHKMSIYYTCNICNCGFRTNEISRHSRTKKHIKNIILNNEENYI